MATAVVDVEEEGRINKSIGEKFTKQKILYLFGMCLIIIAVWILRGKISVKFDEPDVQYRFQHVPGADSNGDLCQSCPPWIQGSLKGFVPSNTNKIYKVKGVINYSPRRGLLQMGITIFTNHTITEHFPLGTKPEVFIDVKSSHGAHGLAVSCFDDNFQAGEGSNPKLCEKVFQFPEDYEVFLSSIPNVKEILTLQVVWKVDKSRKFIADWKIAALMQFL